MGELITKLAPQLLPYWLEAREDSRQAYERADKNVNELERLMAYSGQLVLDFLPYGAESNVSA